MSRRHRHEGDQRNACPILAAANNDPSLWSGDPIVAAIEQSS